MNRAQIPFIILGGLACCLAAASRSVWDGVYSTQQAARGKTGYLEECARCHGENLAGGETAPALVGKDFLKRWNGKTLGDLLETVIRTMPSDDPGNLSRRQYADVTAYVLNANDFPAGAKDLDSTPATLKDIGIEEKR
jgi:mono/diheme cytochrome c family protein